MRCADSNSKGAVMNSSLVRAYIGRGSNLNNPVAQIRSALVALDAISGTCCVAYSSLYRSKPLGLAEQPDYVTAVEAMHGRVREERWGPRTLDLDLLLYGDQRYSSDRLTVPHPGLSERDFVLYPLHEIAPELNIPGAGSLRRLVEHCPSLGAQPLHAVAV